MRQQKGKERVLDDETLKDLQFALWRKTKQDEMLREMEEREIRLARSMGGPLNSTTANVQDNMVIEQSSSRQEESIRLTLGSAEPARVDVSVVVVSSTVALSSTDSTFKTATKSVSFSTDELMDEDDLSSNNCLARIGMLFSNSAIIRYYKNCCITLTDTNWYQSSPPYAQVKTRWHTTTQTRTDHFVWHQLILQG